MEKQKQDKVLVDKDSYERLQKGAWIMCSVCCVHVCLSIVYVLASACMCVCEGVCSWISMCPV